MTDIPLVDLAVHHQPRDVRDHIALGFTWTLRRCAATFFAKRYGHRAIVLETVAAVPGTPRRVCGGESGSSKAR